jgi:hypothetical protein
MKFDFQTLLQRFSLGTLSNRTAFSERKLCSPLRDWVILLGSSALLLGAFLLIGGALFFSAAEGGKAEGMRNTPRADRDLLSSFEKTVERYQARGTRFEEFRSGAIPPPRVSDPSR